MRKFKDLLYAKRVSADQCGELTDKTIALNRVAKVVKGGRRFSFSALVVTGDGQGHVGFGLGKAGEVPEAIRKASESARRSLVKIPIRGTSIPHDLIADYGPTKIVLKSAAPGTGVIAGSTVRAICDSAGITDIHTKCIGSNNPHNVLRSMFFGLLTLKEPEVVASLRGISLDELGYQPY